MHNRAIKKLALAALFAAMTLSLPACNNSIGGFAGAVGNTPNAHAELVFFFTGTAGEPFSATVTDSYASWNVQGTTPYRAVLVNDLPPGAVYATKTANDSNSFVVNLYRGSHLVATASTTAPFGMVSATTKKHFTGKSAPANPDVRVVVKGPAGEHFSGNIEDCGGVLFSLNSVAPVDIIYEAPNGKVGATLDEINSLGPFSVDLIKNGMVSDSASGGPQIMICEGGCPLSC